jgi:hypothetical protein
MTDNYFDLENHLTPGDTAQRIQFVIDILRGRIVEEFFTEYLSLNTKWSATWLNKDKPIEQYNPNRKDDGDIIAYHHDLDPGFIIDTKCSRNWHGSWFPWSAIKLCKQENWHTNWTYIVINSTLSHYVIIKGSLVPPDMIHYEKTGCVSKKEGQMTAAFPLHDPSVHHDLKAWSRVAPLIHSPTVDAFKRKLQNFIISHYPKE